MDLSSNECKYSWCEFVQAVYRFFLKVWLMYLLKLFSKTRHLARIRLTIHHHKSKLKISWMLWKILKVIF